MIRIAVLFASVVIHASLTSQPVKRVLIEESSYATCSQCPDGAYWLDSLLREFPELVGASYHIYADSMTTPETVAWAADFAPGAPMACIDRVDFGGDGMVAEVAPQWRTHILAQLAEPGYADITLTGNWDSVSRNLDISATVTFDSSPDTFAPLRVTFLVVEDSVIGYGPGYDQHNIYNTLVGHPYYGAGDPIVGYPHRHVVRRIPNNDVIQVPPTLYQPYSFSATTGLHSTWHEDRVSVIAFIGYDHQDVTKRMVINAAETALAHFNPLSVPSPAGACFKVAPNPVQAGAAITIEGIDAGTEVVFLNMLGGIIHRHVWRPDEALGTMALAPGIYFVQVGLSVTKMVIAN